MNTFYAYIHCRPDGSPFYVGKGKDRRCYEMRGRSSHHQNVINKYGANNILVGKLECSSENIAFDLEKGLIKCHRRMEVELTNKTDGGDGVSGLVHTSETKEKISALFDDLAYAERHRESVKAAHVRSKELYRASAIESQNRPEILAKHKAYQGALEVRAAKSAWGVAAWKRPEAVSWRNKINAISATPESRLAKSVALKGKNAGRVYVFKDGVVRAVMPDELTAFLQSGWEKGNPKSRGRVVTRGTVWITNAVVNKMVLPDQLIEFERLGWKRGRK